MKKQLKCIMLVDNNPNDNFIHERVIKKHNSETIIIIKDNGLEAIRYIKSMREEKDMQPNLILLDIHMPFMNGWEFLQEYNLLEKDLQSCVIMLSNYDSLDDQLKAKRWSFVYDFITKPLTIKTMEDIIIKHFN